MARLIRDQPADCISLCLGINVVGQASLNLRTFRAAVIGVILTIRDGHPTTPMAVVSPIYSPPRETEPNRAGMTLPHAREQVQDAVAALRRRGDGNLHYISGLDLFGPDEAGYMPDQLHPNTDGNAVLAEHYAAMVMPLLGFTAGT
jgi:lysophospholipase L1-like esterase